MKTCFINRPVYVISGIVNCLIMRSRYFRIYLDSSYFGQAGYFSIKPVQFFSTVLKDLPVKFNCRFITLLQVLLC